MPGLAFRLVEGWRESEANGVQSKRVWARVIGVGSDVVIEAVEFDEPVGEIVVSCRLRRGAAMRALQSTLRSLRPG